MSGKAQSGGSDDADDSHLIAAFLAGDESALAAIVRRYQRPLWKMAMRWTQDADEADDLVQKTFLRMLSHLGNFQGNDLRSYLFRITANLCKNHLRDRARFVLVSPELEESGTEEDFSSGDLDEERQKLRQLIAQLPARQREVVLLRIDGELAFSEVAEALGITQNSAKVNFHHALKRLLELKNNRTKETEKAGEQRGKQEKGGKK